MYRYRPATLEDIPECMDIRGTVRENKLVTLRIKHADYVTAFFEEGRAWVCEADGVVVGFVCGRPVKRDIWALFLREAHEGRGIGTALMDLIEPWMFEQGVEVIQLHTQPGSRADRMYERRGWKRGGAAVFGDVEFTLARPR